MKKVLSIGLLVSLLTLPSVVLAAQKAAKPAPAPVEINAAGSGVNLGVTRLLAEAFQKQHPSITITVPGSIGSRGAVKAVADNSLPLGLLSRHLEKEELNLGLTEKVYARVPIVFAVHPTVKDDGVTSAELNEIFKGTKNRWKDGNPIIVLSREKTDSGFQVIRSKINGFEEAYLDSQQANRWMIHYNDQDANQGIVKTPYAIGVTDLGMIRTEQLKVKVLKLDGVVPGPETILKGRYPLERDLIFLYREQGLAKEARLFMDFVRSAQGQKILLANGYLQVK